MADPAILYTASCNPPRRAKRARVDPLPPSPALSASSLSAPEPDLASAHPRPILPKKSKVVDPPYNPTDSPTTVPPPAKRGRKPGPLSRSAREAQRRLNHSIIEKARRTKINDALATLKQLVPADYGHANKPATSNADESDDEFRGPSKPKPAKREEKEKEFKLEILVRTVSYMQDLLQRVDVLENAVRGCSNCGAKQNKRKRDMNDVDDEDEDRARTSKASNRRTVKSRDDDSTPPTASKPSSPLPTPPESRLPPISSWLPNSVIDPSLLPSTTSSSPSPNQLPSPPSSTHFDPVRSSTIPPALNLGPVATASMLPSSTRTPEDESAASLLLQISASGSSPTTRPVASSTHHLLEPSIFALSSSSSAKHASRASAETPGSILGVSHLRKLSVRK